jgi:hypothetical protein
MKRTNSTFLLVLVTTLLIMNLLSSCYTSMKVRVDIMDRHALSKSKAYQELYLSKLNALAGSSAMFDELKKMYKAQAKAIINEAITKGKIRAHPDVIETTSETVAQNISNKVKTEVTTLIDAFKAGTVTDFYGDFTKLSTSTAQALFSDFSTALRTDLNVADVQAWTDITNKYYFSTTQQYTAIITQYGNSIIEDPLAALVAQAPNKYWRRFKSDFNIIKDDPGTGAKSLKVAKVNKTVVRTFMGTTDIAIKMDAPGIFVIKGVRLDADEAIKASFKVLNQGIKYLAYANGVPVNSPAGSSENTGKIVVLPEKAENDSIALLIENHQPLDKRAKVAFLNILFSQISRIDPAASPTDAEVKQAVDMIQNAYKIFIKNHKH